SLLLLPLPAINALFKDSFLSEAEAFEESLLHQACFNIDEHEACISRLKFAPERGDPRGPLPILHAAIRGTISDAVRTVTGISTLATHVKSRREEMAIDDCVELLGYSVDELEWSLTEMVNIDIGVPSYGSRHDGNIRAWLSAALGNQDTCLDGFDGTDGRVRLAVERRVAHVTQLVSNLLAMHKRLRSVILHVGLPKNVTEGGGADRGFPTWMTPEEEEELVHAGAKSMRVDAVVAADGSGRFRTISEAIDNAPSYSTRRYVIMVKRGEYKENVVLKKKKTNIVLVGEGMGLTVISGSRSFMAGWTTFRTATFAVSGSGFIARDITFRNTAGPQGGQAVALRADSDRSAFFRCSIEGYQDTLYSHSLRQFFRDCNIYGTVDFIFGNGLVVFQHCNIYPRRPLPNQKITITAQGRKDPNQNTGFSIHNCFVNAAYPTYLGRPWKPYSRTVFMQSYLGPGVQPAGWLEWAGNVGLNTLFYGEYMNYGPGASLGRRVGWPGYHIIRDAAVAGMFTVRRFIGGLSWLPGTGVLYTADLLK
ncbi:pectinesterase, partial [Ananas comosus]|uniref:Pectinesterase n=1 Tax=Ananas comosus TaxID=4615 RepID=A0A6P5EY79_ANACO